MREKAGLGMLLQDVICSLEQDDVRGPPQRQAARACKHPGHDQAYTGPTGAEIQDLDLQPSRLVTFSLDFGSFDRRHRPYMELGCSIHRATSFVGVHSFDPTRALNEMIASSVTESQINMFRKMMPTEHRRSKHLKANLGLSGDRKMQ